MNFHAQSSIGVKKRSEHIEGCEHMGNREMIVHKEEEYGLWIEIVVDGTRIESIRQFPFFSLL